MKYILFFLVLGCNTTIMAQASKKPAAKATATAGKPAAKATTTPGKPAGKIVKKAPAKTSLISPVMKASMERGSIVYASYCLACHQADAGGVPNMNPPLTKTEYVLGDKKRLINILLNGLNEEVKINDDTYSNPMPPHNFLTDDQIADVLTYVRNNFGNKASQVNKPEVAKLRK